MTHARRSPVECPTCGKIHSKCKGHKSSGGEPCNRWPRAGSDVCDSHGGRAPQVIARANVRAAVMAWGLGDTTVDPGETLLRLVTQSAARCEMYAGLLGQAYDAAERLVKTGTEGLPESDALAAETARLDLERVFNHGGVASLIGHRYASTPAGPMATGEAIRGLVELEAQERDRCATFAAKAVAAGLAERQVRLAERQGLVMASVIEAVLARAGVDASGELVRSWIGEAIDAQMGGAKVIEGSAA